jgi:manganese/zinc/iron transport system permease protein
MTGFEHLLSFNSLVVLLGTGLLGLSCGVIGSFTVLRERALIGDCIAHASLPGICAAFLLLHDRSFGILFVGAIISGLISAWCVSAIRNHTRIKEDTALALVLSCFFGLGISLSRYAQNQPSGNKAGLDTFILGKAATLSTNDVLLIGGITALTLLVVTALFKELTLLCFDREFARTQGFSTVFLDYTLMTLVCLCTAAGLSSVGAVLIVALLIFPAATARLWTDRIHLMVIASGVCGVVACLGGVLLSTIAPPALAPEGLPTGPLVVLTASAVFTFSYLFAPAHGLIKRMRIVSKTGAHGS